MASRCFVGQVYIFTAERRHVDPIGKVPPKCTAMRRSFSWRAVHFTKGAARRPCARVVPILCGHFLSEPPLPTHAHPAATRLATSPQLYPPAKSGSTIPTSPGPAQSTRNRLARRFRHLPRRADREGAVAARMNFAACPAHPFILLLHKKKVNPTNSKGPYGRAGRAAWAPSRKPSHFRRRLTLRVSYRKQPTPYPNITLNLP
jgi:hypothetical protein